ncbi:MAG: cyclic nucleotide-binding domain-containing protein [Betaproteobacteria bacterium]|nr:cyclic nucleotide-binding domain-containing protein [Betaproteobacteria bacterium]
MDGLSLQVGKYDIQQMLGKGATGTVYLAKDTFSGREVALKTIEPEVFRDPEFGTVYRAQFLNEASLAGKIRHPHIVAILDAVVEENSGHIAMELVTGGDLAQYASKDKLLPVADALQIAFKCCGALDYAFKEGIVHRDIKPANILISKGTEVKISDFGAAFLKKSQAVQTVAMGSPFYMSPEQIEGKELTFHSDMFSMGVVLYELLTGTRPFLGGTLEALVQKILQQDPPAPSTLREGLPKAVDALVLAALMKKPAHRHASWAEFATALSDAVKLVLPPEAIADSEKFTALKKVELLANLPDAELWEIVNAGAWSRMPKLTNLLREGEPGTHFYFLANGQAKVTLQGKLLNLVNELEFVGDMAWILGGDAQRNATVDAMTDMLVAQYTVDALAEMTLGAQLHLTRAVVRNLVDRLALANSRLAR